MRSSTLRDKPQRGLYIHGTSEPRSTSPTIAQRVAARQDVRVRSAGLWVLSAPGGRRAGAGGTVFGMICALRQSTVTVPAQLSHSWRRGTEYPEKERRSFVRRQERRNRREHG